MAVDPLGSRTLQALQRALSGLAARQQVISNNIANIETPRYTALDVRFEDLLRTAMQPPSGPVLRVSHAAHFSDLPPSVVNVRPQVLLSTTPARNDGNNVELEREMTALAETQLTFQALAQLLSSRLQVIRAALSDAR